MQHAPSVRDACRVAGVDGSTAYGVMRQEPEFREAIEDAKRMNLQGLEEEVKLRALGIRGRKASDVLMMFILKKLDPSFRDNYVPPMRPKENVVSISAIYAEMYRDCICGAHESTPG